MISIERGLEIVASVAAARARADWMPVEVVPLEQSLARILRQPALADADAPPFDKAIRDGFALRFEDVSAVPIELRVIGESRAGAAADVTVGSGECCEIMTGAPLPGGANAVVMVENSERISNERVRILRSARKDEGLLRQAAEASRGEVLLAPGRRIRISDIGLLAGAGMSEVAVSRRPRVAIVATGDELVEVAQTPAAGQIRNSNSQTLLAQCKAAGAEGRQLGIARDRLDDLREKLAAGMQSDILLVSGGVSMGKYDLVENVFAELGVEVFFEKVAMKPGKPTVFGYRDGTFVFGLPGNPVSTMVAFHMFVRPVIDSLLKTADSAGGLLQAMLEAPAKCDPERAALVPALVHFESGSYRISAAPWKGSSDIAGLSRSNALMMIPSRSGVLQPGEQVQFLFME